MNLIFQDITGFNSSFNIYNDEIEIGSLQIYPLNDNITIGCIINIYPQFQKQNYGFEIFCKIPEIQEFSTFRAIWCQAEEYNHCEDGMSTNLKIFKENSINMVIEEACWSTPTGKWLRKLGFNNLNIIQNSSEEVIVDFKKN